MRHLSLPRVAPLLLLGALAACQDGQRSLLGLDGTGPQLAEAPAAPSGLTEAAVSPWQIDVAWTDGSSTETSFQLYRRQRNPDFSWTGWAHVGTTGANVTSFSSGPLQPNTLYQHQVRACTTVCSGWAVAYGIRTPDGAPTPPSGLVASPFTPWEIRLSWTDASANETHFELWRRERFADSTSTEWVQIATTGANVAQYRDTTLTPDRIYQYQVRACEPTRCSPWAVSQTVRTAPAAPTGPSNLRATALSPTQIRLAWTDNSTTENYFRILRRVRNGDGSYSAWAEAGRPAANDTSFVDGGLLGGTTYQHQIHACNNVGCSIPWTVGGLVTTPPSSVTPPSDLVATAASPTQVNLTWTDGSTTETGFVLQRRSRTGTNAFGPWAQVAAPAANATSFSDATVEGGVVYQYQVRACNGADCSAFTQSGEVTTPGAPPTAPSSFTGTVASGTRLNLSWTDNSTVETRLELERRVQHPGGTLGAWSPRATLAANVTAYADTGLATGSTYHYQLRACNDVGCSAWVPSPYLTPAVPPSAPSNVQAAPVTSTSLRVTWTDASDNERGFEVYRRVRNPDGSYTAWALRSTMPANGTYMTEWGLTAGTTYQFQVRACNTGGCSAFATSGLVTMPTVPAAPTGLTAARASATQVDLTWTDASSDETYFQLYRRVRNADGTYTAWGKVVEPAANATGYSNTGLMTGTTYQYQLRSCNLAGCSPWAVSGLVTP